MKYSSARAQHLQVPGGQKCVLTRRIHGWLRSHGRTGSREPKTCHYGLCQITPIKSIQHFKRRGREGISRSSFLITGTSERRCDMMKEMVLSVCVQDNLRGSPTGHDGRILRGSICMLCMWGIRWYSNSIVTQNKCSSQVCPNQRSQCIMPQDTTRSVEGPNPKREIKSAKKEAVQWVFFRQL